MPRLVSQERRVLVEDLDRRGCDVEQAVSELGISRETLNVWCKRVGLIDLYYRLWARSLEVDVAEVFEEQFRVNLGGHLNTALEPENFSERKKVRKPGGIWVWE